MCSHLKIENKLEEKWEVPNIEELTSLLGSKVVKLPSSYLFSFLGGWGVVIEEPSKPLGLSIGTQTLPPPPPNNRHWVNQSIINGKIQNQDHVPLTGTTSPIIRPNQLGYLTG